MSNDEYRAEQQGDEPAYGLVMPFVTVASKGGPHDDESYVAGYSMGQLDATLASGVPRHEVTIRSSCEQQADLLAMRYRYHSVIGDAGDEWSFAVFLKMPCHLEACEVCREHEVTE